jgi:hypothetical protein
LSSVVEVSVPNTWGEWIAIIAAVLVALRWLTDYFRDDKKTEAGQFDELWNKYNELRHELDSLRNIVSELKGGYGVEQAWLKTAIERLERKVDNVQAQMRNVATGSNNKVIRGAGDE